MDYTFKEVTTVPEEYVELGWFGNSKLSNLKSELKRLDSEIGNTVKDPDLNGYGHQKQLFNDYYNTTVELNKLDPKYEPHYHPKDQKASGSGAMIDDGKESTNLNSNKIDNYSNKNSDIISDVFRVKIYKELDVKLSSNIDISELSEATINELINLQKNKYEYVLRGVKEEPLANLPTTMNARGSGEITDLEAQLKAHVYNPPVDDPLISTTETFFFVDDDYLKTYGEYDPEKYTAGWHAVGKQISSSGYIYVIKRSKLQKYYDVNSIITNVKYSSENEIAVLHKIDSNAFYGAIRVEKYIKNGKTKYKLIGNLIKF